MLTVHRFRERAAGAVGRVDAQAGVIYEVRIIGRTSKNKRQYTPEALQNAARLYEDVRVFIDHAKKTELSEDRSIKDWAGNLRNVRYERGALYADLHLRREGKYFAEIIEAARDFSRSFGLSHVADGASMLGRDGIEIVESIEQVFSVDLVTIPAANAGLFESIPADMFMGERHGLGAGCVRLFSMVASLAARHPQLGIGQAEVDQCAEIAALAKAIELNDGRQSYDESYALTAPSWRESPYVAATPDDVRESFARLRKTWTKI